jgi:hypothetical protein
VHVVDHHEEGTGERHVLEKCKGRVGHHELPGRLSLAQAQGDVQCGAVKRCEMLDFIQ